MAWNQQQAGSATGEVVVVVVVVVVGVRACRGDSQRASADVQPGIGMGVQLEACAGRAEPSTPQRT